MTLSTHKLWSSICLLAIALGILAPMASVDARTVVRSGDVVSVTDDQVVDGDFYTAARKINLSGEATEDVVAIGQEISVNGSIGDNAFLLADEADIFGTVGDDLRIIARNITIAEPVMGDVFVVANTVHIQSTATIGGDVLIYANEVIIESTVGGDLLGTVETARIDAAIAGDIDVRVGQLTLGDKAIVEGSVKYESNDLLIQAPNATIAGDLVRNDPVLPGNEASVRLVLIPVLVLLFSVLTWYLVARKSLRATVEHALTRSLRPFFVGLLVVLFAPVAGVVLIGSFVGFMVGLVTLLLYIAMMLVGVFGAAAIAGQLAMRSFDHDAGPVGIIAILVGVVIIGLLMLLPYIGQALFAVLLILAVGSMTDLLFRSQH